MEQRITVLANQSNLVFASDAPIKVDLPTLIEWRETQDDPAVVRLATMLRKGQQYTVWSARRSPPRISFGRPNPVPEGIEKYLQLPPTVPERVRQRARRHRLRPDAVRQGAGDRGDAALAAVRDEGPDAARRPRLGRLHPVRRPDRLRRLAGDLDGGDAHARHPGRGTGFAPASSTRTRRRTSSTRARPTPGSRSSSHASAGSTSSRASCATCRSARPKKSRSSSRSPTACSPESPDMYMEDPYFDGFGEFMPVRGASNDTPWLIGLGVSASSSWRLVAAWFAMMALRRGLRGLPWHAQWYGQFRRLAAGRASAGGTRRRRSSTRPGWSAATPAPARWSARSPRSTSRAPTAARAGPEELARASKPGHPATPARPPRLPARRHRRPRPLRRAARESASVSNAGKPLDTLSPVPTMPRYDR